jgi:hypothetical protein
MANKSDIALLNRAFRRYTLDWLGHPDGFSSRREWKKWCRVMAVEMAGEPDAYGPLFSGDVAYETVIEYMHDWGQ